METILQLVNKLSEEKKWKEQITLLDSLLAKPDSEEKDDTVLLNLLREKIKICQVKLDIVIEMLVNESRQYYRAELGELNVYGGVSILSFATAGFPKQDTKYDGWLIGVGIFAAVLCVACSFAMDHNPNKRGQRKRTTWRLKELMLHIRTIQKKLSLADKHLADREIKKYNEVLTDYAFSSLYDFVQDIDTSEANKANLESRLKRFYIYGNQSDIEYHEHDEEHN